MKSIYVANYGKLEWLDPAEYYEGDWQYECTDLEEIDGEWFGTGYDVVSTGYGSYVEYRYTTV